MAVQVNMMNFAQKENPANKIVNLLYLRKENFKFNQEINHVTAYMIVIAFELIALGTFPISEYLVKKLFKNNK